MGARTTQPTVQQGETHQKTFDTADMTSIGVVKGGQSSTLTTMIWHTQLKYMGNI